MKLHRINALLIRHVYLYKRSLPRLMDVFFWPPMDLFLWGFLSIYLEKLNIKDLNLVTFLLGAIIFWTFLQQSQVAVSVAFLEEVWEKNFLNIFITPLTLLEFLVSNLLLGLIRIILVM
ncbi:ABC transporter permease, partial [Candidatus Azambacteria bacterium]|nr:ABC transporter permease [Candidatus Azambacteria bacterium]